MEITPLTQCELETLHEHFTELEQDSLALEFAPAETLLVIRADGIKASKHFLKDSLECPSYHNALHKAVKMTYRLWRDWAPEEFRPYLLGALRLSDEVSLIVTRGDNYFQRRLLKITTTLASTLSGAMSLAYAAEGHRGPRARAPVMAFDGRPLVLGRVGELGSYIRWRRLLYARNGMAKVLRLKSELSDDDLYGQSPRLASDIHRLSFEVGSRNLWSEYECAAAGSALYVAEADGGLQGHTLVSDPADDLAVHRALGKLLVAPV